MSSHRFDRGRASKGPLLLDKVDIAFLSLIILRHVLHWQPFRFGRIQFDCRLKIHAVYLHSPNVATSNGDSVILGSFIMLTQANTYSIHDFAFLTLGLR